MRKNRTIMERRKARAIVLQALFEVDASNHPLEVVSKRLLERSNLSDIPSIFAIDLTYGIRDNVSAIDKIIEKHAPAWPIEDLSIIDRNILRMAIYQLKFDPEPPPKIVANEAVELAKLFGSDSSARFVNGVLGSVLRDMIGQELEKNSKYTR